MSNLPVLTEGASCACIRNHYSCTCTVKPRGAWMAHFVFRVCTEIFHKTVAETKNKTIIFVYAVRSIKKRKAKFTWSCWHICNAFHRHGNNIVPQNLAIRLTIFQWMWCKFPDHGRLYLVQELVLIQFRTEAFTGHGPGRFQSVIAYLRG